MTRAGPPPISRRGRLLGFLASLVVRGVGRTLRWTVIGAENIARASAAGRVCWASWHGRQMLTVSVHAHQNIVILASLSADGDIQSAMLERLGYRVERGSSSRGAARGLLAMARAMREGFSPAIAVDGPRGPRHEVKQGIVALAKYEGAAIIPTMASCERAWVIPSWDRTLIPKPFTRAVIEYGEPLPVPTDASDEVVESTRARLETVLVEMTGRCDRHFGERQVESLARAFAKADAHAERRARRKSDGS